MNIRTLPVKTAALVLAGVVAAASLPGAAQAKKPIGNALQVEELKPALRTGVKVTGRYVTLGDMFENIDEKLAETQVAYAPEPGKKAIFDAKWLFRVSKAYKLGWLPLSRLDRSVVERDSIVIGREEIETAVLNALVDDGADPESLVDFSNRSLRIWVAAEADAAVEVVDVNYNQRTRRFTAIVAAPAGDPEARRHRLTGRVHKMAEVPVLARAIIPGEVIRKNDIQWIQARADRLQRDTLTDPRDLIGKTPRRGLRSGSPVRSSEVRRPVLASKGSLVTMVFRADQMTLTTRGRALEDGSEGDAIRISNSKSSAVVEGVVTGSNLVAVTVIGATATN